MLPYLITFSLSLISYRFATKPLKKRLRILCLVLCILPPAILAGVRDPSLGHDWFGYGIDIWNLSIHSHTPGQVLSQYPAIESGYKLFNYAISFLSSNYHVFFFFHQLFLISIAVFVAYINRNHKLSEIILVFYFLYIYNTSMNIIRQSMALVLCMLAFTLWEKLWRKRSYICLGLAGLFHVSAVFAFFLYFLSTFKKILQKHQIIIFSIVSVVTYYTIKSYTLILTKLIDLKIFSGHYIGYADQIGDVSIHKTDIVFQIGIIALTFLLPSKYKNKAISSQIFYLALTAVALNMFGNLTDIAFRVAHYFILPIAILMPRISFSYKHNLYACLIFASLLAARLIYFAISSGAENTIPYTSAILGI